MGGWVDLSMVRYTTLLLIGLMFWTCGDEEIDIASGYQPNYSSEWSCSDPYEDPSGMIIELPFYGP